MIERRRNRHSPSQTWVCVEHENVDRVGDVAALFLEQVSNRVNFARQFEVGQGVRRDTHSLAFRDVGHFDLRQIIGFNLPG